MDAEDAAVLSRAGLRAEELWQRLEAHRGQLEADCPGRPLMDRAVDAVRRVADELGNGVRVESPS